MKTLYQQRQLGRSNVQKDLGEYFSQKQNRNLFFLPEGNGEELVECDLRVMVKNYRGYFSKQNYLTLVKRLCHGVIDVVTEAAKRDMGILLEDPPKIRGKIGLRLIAKSGVEGRLHLT